MVWFNSLTPNAQAAIIAACVTLLGIFLKDFFGSYLQDRKSKKESSISIFRKYADPLAFSATNLFWRLNEVFYSQGRGDYLKSEAFDTNYDNYKKLSTLYRLGCIIAWIRAYKRELFYFELHSPKKLENLNTAISKFESALADGPHIEIQRLKNITKLWDIKLPEDDNITTPLGIKVEQLVKAKIESADFALSSKLSENEQIELCKELSNLICNQLDIKSLPDQIINETKCRAIQMISTREAWLYRDWQAGIGDLLIKETNQSSRYFEVIGYYEFEELVENESDEKKKWIHRLKRIIENLDVSKPDPYDARIDQLKNIFISTAQIIKALKEVKVGQNSIHAGTYKKARSILESN